MQMDVSANFGRYGVTVVVACLAVGALIEDLAGPTVTIQDGTYDRGPEAVIVVTLAVAAILVAMRGRLGVAAPLAALAAFALASFSAHAWLLDSVFVYLLVMLICGLGGFLARTPIGHAGLLVVIGTGSLAVWHYPKPGWGQWVSVVTFVAIAWAAGELLRGPVARAHSAEQRASQLEQEQARAARQAVIDERQRIARELHDIIAHSVSVMTVQAGGVRRQLAGSQTRERDSLLAVERTGREALTEMRRLVGLLNEEEASQLFAAARDAGAGQADRHHGRGRPARRAGGRRPAARTRAGRRPDRLPDRAGGADQHAQVRRPGPGKGDLCWTVKSSSSTSRTTGDTPG